MVLGQLEHLIRACADIADDDEIVVVGSQAVLNTRGATGLCMEAHDLVLAKLARLPHVAIPESQQESIARGIQAVAEPAD